MSLRQKISDIAQKIDDVTRSHAPEGWHEQTQREYDEWVTSVEQAELRWALDDAERQGCFEPEPEQEMEL
jgi:hypothetical protein